jgi:ferredoxin-NADP reductase
MLFLSAGSGITPLMSMSRWLCDLSASVDVKFLNSIQAPQDLVFRGELEMLAGRHPRTFQSVITTTSRESAPDWRGLTGRISREMMQKVAPDLAERVVYLCGPDGFMKAARELLGDMGFNLQHLHSESFAPARSHSDETVQGTESAAGAPVANDNGAAKEDATKGGGTARSNANAVSVEFARAGKRVSASKQLPLLDIAEAHGVELEYGCRVGNCGECKVKLLHGKASGGEAGLTEEERRAGYVLSCVATPDGDCVVDV